MDAGLLKTLGQILGIGGLALGIFFLLFREIRRAALHPRARDRALVERLRVGIAALNTVQLGEVVEVGGDGRMVRSERLLVDRDRALVERLRVGIAAPILVQLREVVEAGGDGRMVRSERLL
jgi:hypothetical protein